MSEYRTLYEGEFEHSGSGRTVSIDVELEHYSVGGGIHGPGSAGILILSLNGHQIHGHASGVITSSWPDTPEGRDAMCRDLETIKHKLALAQRAVREHAQSKAVTYLDRSAPAD